MNGIRLSTRGTLRRLALALCGALLISSCSMLADTVNDATAAPTTTALERDAEADADPPSPTGPVPHGDYEAGLNALSTCMQQNRAELTARVRDPITGIFTYDFDPVYADVHQACYDEHFADLDARYRAQPTYEAELTFSGPSADLAAYPDDSWVRLLAAIPDSTDTRYHPVTIVDLTRTRDAFDITLPGDSATESAVETYRTELALEAGLLPVGPLAAFGRLATPAERQLELGFDARAWDALVEAGAPDMPTTLLSGRFDPVTIDEAVRNDPNWREQLIATPVEDSILYSWGIDGGLDLDLASPVRPIGEFRKMALFGDVLVWARNEHAVTGTQASLDGTRRNLADVEAFRRLAERADTLGLHSAMLTMRFDGFVGNSEPDRAEEFFVNQPSGFMIGDGVDDEGSFVSFVIIFPDELSAENNAAAITHRIESAAGRGIVDRSQVELEEARATEIVVDGALVEAKIWLVEEPLPPIESIIRFNHVPGLGTPLPMVSPPEELSETR